MKTGIWMQYQKMMKFASLLFLAGCFALYIGFKWYLDSEATQIINSNVTDAFQESLTIEKVVSRISDCPSYFERLRNMIFQGFQANLTRYVCTYLETHFHSENL